MRIFIFYIYLFFILFVSAGYAAGSAAHAEGDQSAPLAAAGAGRVVSSMEEMTAKFPGINIAGVGADGGVTGIDRSGKFLPVKPGVGGGVGGEVSELLKELKKWGCPR